MNDTLATDRSGLFPHYPEGVPDALKPGKLWVCCNHEKAPMVAEPACRFASSTNPETWRSYEEALDCYEAGRFPGLGRVIESGSGLVGVDIDNCRCPHTGRIDSRGRRILDALDSYSEVSPSGTGVKVWVRSDVGRSYVKEGLEVYAGRRYFTVTGQILPWFSESIEERSGVVRELVASEFPRPQPARRGGDAYSGPRLDLDEVLDSAGVDVLAEISDGQAARKYRVLCPWSEQHTTAPETGTVVGQYPDGACFYHCWHSHCHGRRWRDFINRLRWVKSWQTSMPGYTGGGGLSNV